MFAINEDKTIHLTRGDIANIEVTAKTENGEKYIYQEGDKIRIQVFKRKDCKEIVLTKEVAAVAGECAVTIYLDKEDTKIGEIISKPAKYWYEIELNPNTKPQTLIGYDEDGEKIFMLYPEGSDVQ